MSSSYASLQLPNDQCSFRLFSINGSLDRDAPIIGTLSIAHLNDRPVYETLSYCWGNPEPVDDVLINGDTKIPITASLSSALRALRLQHKARVFWIDAICIDQSNVSEKNFQVQLMRRIYATGGRTIVWLGSGDASSRRAFQMIRKSPEQYSSVLEGILRRPWFRRVWVIQEVAFAPEVLVQCGEDSVDWGDLVGMCSRVNRLRFYFDVDAAPGSKSFHPSFYARIMGATRERMKRGERLSALEALKSFRSFEATNSLDKVYGVLGLLEDPAFVNVDYNKSVQEVFSEVALTTMRTSQSLDILAECQPRETARLAGLSSWIPDWADSEQYVEQEIEDFAVKEGFHASRHTSLDQMVVVKDGSLQVSAHFIATIAELAPPWPSIQELRNRILPRGRLLPRRRGYNLTCNLLDLLQSWKDVACRINGSDGTLQDRYVTNESMLEVFYSTLNTAPPFADFEDAQKNDKWIYSAEYLLSYMGWWQKHIAQALPWPLVWIVSGPYVWLMCIFVVFVVVSGRAVLEPPPNPSTPFRSTWSVGRTSNGLFGLFPSASIVAPQAISSRPEDAAVILKGGSRPYVLREQGKKWRVIGDAYIHGIMYGAAFDERQCVAINLL